MRAMDNLNPAPWTRHEVPDNAAVQDKELRWVVGGTHCFLGQPDLQARVYDRIESGLGARGMPAGG